MQRIPDAVAAEALDLLNQSLNLVKPYLTALTPADRHDLPKVADGTEPFLHKSIIYLENNAQFRPAYMDVNVVKDNYLLNQTLTPFKATLDSYASLVSDTKMKSGSEAFTGALQYYNNLKIAVKNRIPGAKTILDDLKQRFEKKKINKDETPDNGNSNTSMTAIA